MYGLNYFGISWLFCTLTLSVNSDIQYTISVAPCGDFGFFFKVHHMSNLVRNWFFQSENVIKY